LPKPILDAKSFSAGDFGISGFRLMKTNHSGTNSVRS